MIIPPGLYINADKPVTRIPEGETLSADLSAEAWPKLRFGQDEAGISIDIKGRALIGLALLFAVQAR